MKMYLNGESVEYSLESEKTLSDVLTQVDSWLEKSGLAILGVDLDGETVTPEAFSARMDTDVGKIRELRLVAGSVSGMRADVLKDARKILLALKEAAETGDTEVFSDLAADYPRVAESFSGLFAPDEISFLDYLADAMSSDSPEGDFPAKATDVLAVLEERIDELERPEGELLKASDLFERVKGSLAEIPLFLQTGRDREAMKTVFAFTEIMGKLIRVMPELSRKGVEVFPESESKSFYSGMNEILRTMMQALESKDSVLIGDIAEYEILPRMESFFTRAKESLKP